MVTPLNSSISMVTPLLGYNLVDDGGVMAPITSHLHDNMITLPILLAFLPTSRQNSNLIQRLEMRLRGGIPNWCKKKEYIFKKR